MKKQTKKTTYWSLSKAKKTKQIIKKRKTKHQIKSCEEHFQECIKNQKIPADTPPYL